MNNLFVQMSLDGTEREFMNFSRINDYGIELTSFALPSVLDGNLKTYVQSHRKILKDFQNELSVHGVFMDIITASRDRRVAGVARRRILQNIEIAKELRATIVNFSSCFNPCIATSTPTYIDGYVKRQVKFWSEICRSIADSNLTIVFENLWESQPEIVKRVLEGVNSNKFRTNLDTGHVNLYSKVPIESWLDCLAEYLFYVHLNDNCGDSDNNLGPGDGTIKWLNFFDELKRIGLEPRICLEVEAHKDLSRLENTKRAIEYLKKNRFLL